MSGNVLINKIESELNPEVSEFVQNRKDENIFRYFYLDKK